MHRLAIIGILFLFLGLPLVGSASGSPLASPNANFTAVYQINNVFTGVNWTQNSLIVVTPQYDLSPGEPSFDIYNMTHYYTGSYGTFVNKVFQAESGQTVLQTDNYYSGSNDTTFISQFYIAKGTNYPFSDGVYVPTSGNFTSDLNTSFYPVSYLQAQFHTAAAIYVNNVSLQNNTGTFFYGFSPFKNGVLYGTAYFSSNTSFNITVNGQTYTNTRTLTVLLPVGSYKYNATANGVTLQGIVTVQKGEISSISLNFKVTNFDNEYVLLAFLIVVIIFAMAFSSYMNGSLNVFFSVVFAGLYFGYFLQVPYIDSTVMVTITFFVIAFGLYFVFLRGSGGTKTELLPITEFLGTLDFLFIFIINLMGLSGVVPSVPNAAYYLSFQNALNTANSSSWLYLFFPYIFIYLPAAFIYIGNVLFLVLQYISYFYSLVTSPLSQLVYPVNTIFSTITMIILAVALIMSIQIVSSGLRGSSK